MASEWVKRSKRNPDKSGNYLCCYAICGTYIYAVWDYLKDMDGWNVCHGYRDNELFPEYWQELPAPPLEEDFEEQD